SWPFTARAPRSRSPRQRKQPRRLQRGRRRQEPRRLRPRRPETRRRRRSPRRPRPRRNRRRKTPRSNLLGAFVREGPSAGGGPYFFWCSSGVGASTMAGLPLRIIAGLGNPGPEHQTTRHNAGFWFVDLLARRHGGEFRDYRKYSGETARITIAGQELLLLKPTTYMNRSGLSVGALSDFLKVPPEEILVVYDELDLPVGNLRLKKGGGHGGHNGLRDVIAHLGDAFWRLRI